MFPDKCCIYFKQDLPDRGVLREREEKEVLKDPVGLQDREDQLDPVDHKEHQGFEVDPEDLDLMVNEDHLENEDHRENLEWAGPRDHLVLQEG